MKLIRVFPRKTNLTPDDADVRVNCVPELWDCADMVHVSVTWDDDRKRGEELAKEWSVVAEVKLGGPAYGDYGGEFTPGLYVKRGAVITSRGCPNRCWFCRAWRNEGNIVRELEIHDGWNILDNNILACSRKHQERVFTMMAGYAGKCRFSGGLEALRFTDWHAEWMTRLKPMDGFFAYDEPSDWEPLLSAAKLLRQAGMIARGVTKRFGSYVLCGWRGDTVDAAKARLDSVIGLGLRTQCMLYDNGSQAGGDMKAWRDLRYHYTNPAEVGKRIEAAMASW